LEDIRSLKRSDRGVMLVYLQRLSGYSRAQAKRLVAAWLAGAPLVKRYRAGACLCETLHGSG